MSKPTKQVAKKVDKSALTPKRFRRILAGADENDLDTAEPSPAEREAMRKAVKTLKDKPSPAYFEVSEAGDGVSSPHNHSVTHLMQVMAGLGTSSRDFAMVAMGGLEYSTRTRGSERNASVEEFNAALAFVQSIAPKNELESSLAIQMAGTNSLAMELLCKARHADVIRSTEFYTNLAVKVQRTFIGQVEALCRLRGVAQQTVRVEHVTVEAGAQAIVGDVHHHQLEGGGRRKRKGQSHAAKSIGNSAPLLGADKEGNGVSISGGERPEAVPYARGNQSRRTKGQ